MKANITITRYYCYEVEGDTERDCVNNALDQFCSDVGRPVASFWYDDIDIEEIETESE